MTLPTESAAHVMSRADFAPLSMQTHNKLEEAPRQRAWSLTLRTTGCASYEVEKHVRIIYWN